MSEEETNESSHLGRSLYIFGTDVSKIPCYRSSMLNGAGTGVVGGLVYFLFTSKVRMSTHVGFGTFWVSTFAYWFHCRYVYAQTKFTINQMKDNMKLQALLEGTEHDTRQVDPGEVEVATV